MTTLLSSRLTFFMKFVFPAIWGGGWSFATAMLFRESSTTGTSPFAKWMFFGLLILGGFFCRRIAFPLKRVILEDDVLRISNYRQEIRVPIRRVRSAGFEPGIEINNRSLVGVEFDQPTPFGRSIEFMPRSREAVELFRARLGPEIGGPPSKDDDDLAAELRGRGTV